MSWLRSWFSGKAGGGSAASVMTGGTNSPAVSAGGDVSITYNLVMGDAELELDLRHRLKASAESERELLLTELRAIELVGRDEELAALEAWLNSPRSIAVRCITGRAGSGKTR